MVVRSPGFRAWRDRDTAYLAPGRDGRQGPLVLLSRRADCPGAVVALGPRRFHTPADVLDSERDPLLRQAVATVWIMDEEVTCLPAHDGTIWLAFDPVQFVW
jgi:hypothetical protein